MTYPITTVIIFSTFSSLGAATVEAKHVLVRQPPVDAVAAAEQNLDERHEEPGYDDARNANVDAANNETYKCPVRQ